MRTDIPESILDSSQELSPDALVYLYRILLTDQTLFLLSPQQEHVWQGETYESVPCHMTGIGNTSDGEVIRPRFSFVNPGGIFTSSLYEGRMDNAKITRIRILAQDLLADNDFAITESFRVKKVLSINKSIAVVELRDVLDGHNFKLPARQFMPPEFSHVKLR
jgi:phage-related protein